MVGLAGAREAGDLWSQGFLLPQIADLDLRAGRIEDAAAHLRELLQIAVRTGGRGNLLDGLEGCAHLCASTGRHAEAVTAWAALAVLADQEDLAEEPWLR